MALTNGSNLGLLVNGDEGEGHYLALMRQWRGLDVLVQCNVISIATAPPGSPINGSAYIVAASGASGAFTGQANNIARYTTALTPAAWEFFVPKTGWQAFVSNLSSSYRFNGSTWAAVVSATPSASAVQSIIVACSDETTALASGLARVTFRMPYGFTLQSVRASVTTAPTGAPLIADVNLNGTSIFGANKLSIDATERTSFTAATAAALATAFLPEDSEITVDIDQVGSTIAGTGLKVMLIGERT